MSRSDEATWQFERPPDLPLPQPSAEAEPYFAGLSEGKLLIQRCEHCGALSTQPGAMCRQCGSTTFGWLQASGIGEVYSYVVTHQAVHPALRGYTPFATIEVALQEGPHLTSNLIDVPPEEIKIGMAVEVVFETVADGVVLPLFQRRAT